MSCLFYLRQLILLIFRTTTLNRGKKTFLTSKAQQNSVDFSRSHLLESMDLTSSLRAIFTIWSKGTFILLINFEAVRQVLAVYFAIAFKVTLLLLDGWGVTAAALWEAKLNPFEIDSLSKLSKIGKVAYISTDCSHFVVLAQFVLWLYSRFSASLQSLLCIYFQLIFGCKFVSLEDTIKMFESRKGRMPSFD